MRGMPPASLIIIRSITATVFLLLLHEGIKRTMWEGTSGKTLPLSPSFLPSTYTLVRIRDP